MSVASKMPQHLQLDRLRHTMRHAVPSSITGTVWSVGHNAVEAVGLPAPMGATCEIVCRGDHRVPVVVIGFEGSKTLLAPLDGAEGITSGDPVRLKDSSATLAVSDGLIGRVIDAAGQPIDSGEAIQAAGRLPLDCLPISAVQRPTIKERITTGVKTVDSMLTLGKGQRIGIFAGSGVGKSTLLGMMARGTDADVVVIGLVGERGREVQEYLERELDPASRKKCVTVVATSDQSALRRVQAAMTATTIAEYFRDQGKNVLLMMDSVTRFAMAQREIGLAAGEAPTSRGYPPSVFSMLPRLVERSGTSTKGSITGIYTVLVEGDDTNEPISDTLRGLLDGHVVLSRKIAEQGRYPAIDILASLSRLQTHLVSDAFLEATRFLRQLLAIYKENEDLITIGAYQRGSNPQVDLAVAAQPLLLEFFTQASRENFTTKQTEEALMQLVGRLQQASGAANQNAARQVAAAEAAKQAVANQPAQNKSPQ